MQDWKNAILKYLTSTLLYDSLYDSYRNRVLISNALAQTKISAEIKVDGLSRYCTHARVQRPTFAHERFKFSRQWHLALRAFVYYNEQL